MIVLVALLLAGMVPTDALVAVTPRDSVQTTVWYLGHCGFAVRINQKLLVFDYVSGRGSPPADSSAGGLDDGYIQPGDLDGLDVYVFITHSHSDHYDPTILQWADWTKRIEYFFGWKAGDDARHHYLVGPRATAEVDGIRVYTINSHHSGVPEVGYLVQVKGIWIYHNGDYRQDYIPDFEYLSMLTHHMHLVFTAGLHDERWQYTHQAHYLMEHFRPDALFPMHHGGAEERGAEFARVMAERGYDTFIPVPRRRGDRWAIGG
jgi:L-ascorbate metabolism protein UlaG (beta-lactamase superfamily)